MGNEASLEGGDGSLSELPEGLSSDGKGGFVQSFTGEKVDLSHLSEEERNKLVAQMSRGPGVPPGSARDAATLRASAVAETSKAPTGLSKSRTIDAFSEGPPLKPKPGRSPSSLSLFESRFRQEPKDPPESRSSMFSSGFLSGANPLSAVSSAVSSSAANISKLSLFGDDEEEEQVAKQQGKSPTGPAGQRKSPQQQGPRPTQGQGPPKGQVPSQQGPHKGQGPSKQGPPKGQGPSQSQQGDPPEGHGQPTGPGPLKPGPTKPAGTPSAPGRQQKDAPGHAPPTDKSRASFMCPLCKATELNIQAKDQPPNYNTCTQCSQQVCSLCGFSPPDSEGKEWLCLNCQMQRALGGADPPVPPMMKPSPSKEGSAPPSPQRGGPPLKGESKRPPMLTKQKSIIDSGKTGTPPVTPKLKSPGPQSPNAPLSPKGSLGPGSQPGSQPGSPGPKVGSPNIDPKTGRPLQQQGSPAKSAPQPKQDTSFFGGFGFGGLTDMTKPPNTTSQAAESVTGKLFSGFGGSKPQGTSSQSTESVTGKLFGGLGGLTEASKPPAAEAVSGKVFGFGSSLLSSATNLISSNQEDENADSPPGSPPDSPIDSGADSPPGSPPDSGSDSPPDTPPAMSKEVDLSTISGSSGGAPKAEETPSALAPATETLPSCPLCKTELNMNTPNYSICTECKKTVCNACGFNPAPHLGENEWVCLNCQTQRALSGQLGDIPPSPKPSPAKQPMKPAPKASPPSSPVSTLASSVPTAPPSPTSKASFEKDPSIAHDQAKQPELNSDKTVDHRPSAQAEAAMTVDQPESDIKTEELDLNKAQTPENIPEKADGTLNQIQHSDAANTSACSIESVMEGEATQAKMVKNVDHSPPDEQKPKTINSEGNQTTAVESDSPLLVKESIKCTEPEPEAKMEGTLGNSSSHCDKHIPESINTGENQSAAEESESLVEQSRELTQPQANVKENKEISQHEEKVSQDKCGQEVEVKQDSNPATLSDIAKLESTVLPILEAQSTTAVENDLEKSSENGRRRLEVLTILPGPSPEEDGQGETQEKVSTTVTVGPKADQEILEGGGEKKPSEQFIENKNMKMNADGDEIRDQEQKREQDGKEKSESGRGRRLLKKSSITPEDDSNVSNLSSPAKPLDSLKEVAGRREQPSEDAATVLRHFKTIELNSTTAAQQTFDDGEPESLTDSPEDRSRGEGSSSLHASSFTPGTSPTSLSSLDEDSDSSSPSHTRSSGEGKQHRKAKHRQPGQMLPTIEDSSEEEELREEEELLREQEKQKSSGKKSRKDKEDIRAQRRRDHPKTPPSNLSPIEDASPTEELRQEAEMEEIRRSSCSDFSPSMESEPEGFEVSPEKIAAVQKVYQLPTSVSLYSPTDEHHTDSLSKEKKILKSADEAYEEIMLKAKSPVTEKVELPPCQELFHGSMLIEDYAYESVVEDKCDKQETDKMSVPAMPKQLRSPDEVYEDMMQKKMIMLKEQVPQQPESLKDIQQSESIIPLSESNSDIICTSNSEASGKDGKPLLDAETAYEELIKRQNAVLTPGTSPTQLSSEPETSVLKFTTQDNISVQDTGSLKRLYPIPDLRVIQCSSGEEEPDEESGADHTKTVGVSEIMPGTEAETEQSTVVLTDQQTVAVPSASEIDINPVPPFEKTSSKYNVISSEIPDIPSLYTDSQTTETDQLGVVDLSKSSVCSQTNSSSTSLPSLATKHAHPVVVSVSPLPTVPQYIPSAPSVVSTAPPVPPKPAVLRRGLSQEKTDIPVPPPLPPPTLPKPTVHPKMIAPQVLPRCTSSSPIPLDKQPGGTTHKPHIPPPVPPKPSTIPAGLTFSHRPGESVKPPIAPKPLVHPPSPIHSQARPTVLTTEPAGIALNLSPSVDSRPGTTSPKSPSSPRHTKTVHETYVVITLPSQPSSPVEAIQSQAPAGSGFASSTVQPQACPHPPQQQSHTQSDPQPQQTTKVPLAFTRITESIESQEICGPEKVVSSMSHVYEAISASAQPPMPLANGVTQVVTTELQRTTVSVVHERAPGMPTPRSTGVSSNADNLKTQPQNSHIYYAGEVVDLRTPKLDAETPMKGVDLSSSELRRQSLATDGSPRQTSAVQSSVVNLSTESPASMSVMTDSITILTCTATIAYGSDASQATSLPLQLTTAKSFEPVSQIIYRPVDAQPEKPINLSTSVGKAQTLTVTTAPSSVTSGFGASVPPRLETCVSGAVDLSTAKPVQTIVSVDKSTTEVMTSVISEEDGKPVDLTASRRAVCCDVVYKLPFAASCTTQQPTPLPEDRFGYRDDHYQYDRSPYGMKSFAGIKPSMSDTNLAEAGLFVYKSKNSYDYNGAIEGAVDLTSGKMSEAGEAVTNSRVTGVYSGMSIPQFSQTRITPATGTPFVVTSVLRSSNGIVYSSVAAPNPSTYAITTQPGSIFSTTYNTLSGMHTSDTMPSLSSLQNQPITRSQSFVSTLVTHTSDEQEQQPLNLEIIAAREAIPTALSEVTHTLTTAGNIDSYTDSSLEAIAASIEALSSPMVPGDEQYQMERELLELEKMKQQRLAEELEWERQEIQRFREQEQLIVQKELEELQAMKQQILCQQEEERQAHLMMQKETYAQQQQQLEQIQRLQEQLRQQLEEQKLRQMYPGDAPDALLGITESRKIMDSGVQTDEEDNTEQAYSSARKKRNVKKGVDSSVQTDDEDQDEWDVPARARRSRSRGVKNSAAESGGQLSVQTEISVQTDSSGAVKGHSLQVDARVQYSDSERSCSPQRDKRRPTPLEIGQPSKLTVDPTCLQVAPVPPKSPKVLYSPISPCVSPSKSIEFVSYEKSLGDTSQQKIHAAVDASKTQSTNTRTPRVIQRSLSDPKPMSPTGEERATQVYQQTDGQKGKASPIGTPSGTQKKVKRTLPNPPSEEETATTGQAAYSTASARRRLCRSTNMARAKILQDIDKELDLVERESSKLRKKQAELDEEEKEIDAKLRYLEMGISRRKDALLKEREKRERAYLQSVAEDRDYMSDSEVSNIRETRHGGSAEEVGGLGLERPHTAPQSELEQFVPPQTKHEAQFGKYSQYQYPQQTLYQHSLYQPQQPYHSQSMYSSIPSLTASQQRSYHQMLLLQQKARQQAALLSELDATKMTTNYDVIRSQPDNSSYLGEKYGNHLDLRSLEERDSSIAVTPMSNVSNDSFYTDVEHHQAPRSYLLLEDAADLTKGSSGLSESTYSLAEKELAKAEHLLRRTAADVGTDYLESSTRLHAYEKAQEDEDSMEEPYELKLLKQQLKQEFRRSHPGTESLEQLAGLPHHYYTPSSGVSSNAYRPLSKTDRYSISRLTLEKQAAKQLPPAMLYQKQKTPLMDSKLGKYSSTFQDSKTLETDYTSYLGSSSASPRSSKLLQDEISFGLRKNITEQQKYLGSNMGNNLPGGLNIGQSLNLISGARTSLGEDSSYPSGSRSRPSSRPSSVYGLDLSIKRDVSSSSLRLKAENEASTEVSAYQTPSGRTKPTSLPIGPSGRGRIPIVAQNSEEESPLSPVGQPMGMARASAGPLPPISADSRDQFGSCLSLQDPQQQHLRDEQTRISGYVLMDDLQGTMSDSEAYHLQREETDWFMKPQDCQHENGRGSDRRQMKSMHFAFPHVRVKLQRDPKDHSVSGNGLGIRVVGGKEVPGSNGEIGAYVAKVQPGGAAEQTGKIVEGMQVLEWNGIVLTGKTYEEVQGLVGQQCGEAEICIRLDLNMLSVSESCSQHLELRDPNKGDRQRSPGVDPKQLAAELQKVSQQQTPVPTVSSLSVSDKGPLAVSTAASTISSSIPSPGQPSSPSVSKKRHGKTSDAARVQAHPVTGEIQLQINYDKQLGNLIVHVLQARNLSPRDSNGYSDPFVKVYLLPGRGQVMVVQNASAESRRRSKHVQRSLNPEWNQTVIYKNIQLEQLRKKTLEVSVWDYDKCSSNDFLGEVLIDLSNGSQLDNVPRWLTLKEQSDGEHHRRSHSGQGRQHSPKTSGHSSQHSPKNQDSPKSSVTKSRSHGIFPDPAKDTQMPTIEKSHSSPGTSKPSPSEGQGRSHGSSRSSSKSAVARTHHQDSVAPSDVTHQQRHHLQPSKRRK
ncbi:hypothetical protein ACEWY4_001333 [Coilia grayii]|uniref:Protein piccolo-like n=1 Tax=Coilia grayii TaxID=363190 RepID=A0ABD1KSP7_9TELE